MVSNGERRTETTAAVICGREAADRAVIEKGGKWPFLLGVLMIAAYLLGGCGFRGSASGDNKAEGGRETGKGNGGWGLGWSAVWFLFGVVWCFCLPGVFLCIFLGEGTG